jgi:4-diphosphocytidyl-2C-methyl-D-erythritol kinase
MHQRMNLGAAYKDPRKKIRHELSQIQIQQQTKQCVTGLKSHDINVLESIAAEQEPIIKRKSCHLLGNQDTE